MSVRFFLWTLIAIAGLAMPISAQAANSAADESSAKMTVKNFGVWSLHCKAAHDPGAEPLCVIAETVQTSDNKTVAVISVGRKHPGDPLNIVVTLPPNVSFPGAVHIRTAENDKWGLELPWQRCIPGACIAGGELSPATVAHWSSLQTEGKIVFNDAGGDEAAIPMSLRGFGDAYKALNQ